MRICPNGAAEAGIDAGEADRRDAARYQRCDERRVRRTGKHGNDGVERRRVGDSQSVDFSRLDLPALQLGINRLSAAVHDDERTLGRDGRTQCRDLRPPLILLEELAAKLEYQWTVHRSPVRSSKPHAT